MSETNDTQKANASASNSGAVGGCSAATCSRLWNGKPGKGKAAQAIHRKTGRRLVYNDSGISSRWEIFYDQRAVRVMTVAEGYAMVRRPGAMPYVAPLKEIFSANTKD